MLPEVEPPGQAPGRISQGDVDQAHRFFGRPAAVVTVQHRSLATLREKLIKTGVRLVRRAEYVTVHMAEVAVPRQLFRGILERIQRFGVPPPVTKGGGQ